MTVNVTIGTTPSIRTAIKDVNVNLANLGDLLDVDADAAVDGSVLIYDDVTAMWVAQLLLEETEIDGGTF